MDKGWVYLSEEYVHVCALCVCASACAYANMVVAQKGFVDVITDLDHMCEAIKPVSVQ